MIDSEEILRAVCGDPDVAAFKRVKATTMRFADAARHVIADDLDGVIPESGKQFMDTQHGRFRLAAKANSDNSTEASAHQQMGARPVVMFGDPTAFRRAQGWISIEELYDLHHKRLRPERLIRLAAKRVESPLDKKRSRAAPSTPRPVVRSSRRSRGL